MSEPTPSIRLYLGNLPPVVSEKDIRERLKAYGRAANVDIKHRQDHEGRVTSTFAHCTLNINQANIQKCLAEINQQKWNGFTTKAEVAKESYLQRMQAKLMSETQHSNPTRNTQEITINKNTQCIEENSKHWEKNSDKKLDSKKIKNTSFSNESLNKTDSLLKKKQVCDSKTEERSEKRKYQEDTSDSEVEVFWQKNFQSEQAVEMDIDKPMTGQVQLNPGSLLSKLESFSSVWGDSSVANDSTPFRIKDSSPGKNKQFEQATSFDTHRNTDKDKKWGKREQNGVKTNAITEVKKNGFEKQTYEKREVAKNINVGVDEPIIKWDPTKSKRQQMSEQKRLKSLAGRVDQKDQQQAMVSQALAGQPANKKIKFDDCIELPSAKIQLKPASGTAEKPSKLFDDSENSDAEHDFAVRKQFEGIGGKKLLELQSRFATDSRFRLDSRFAESGSEDEQSNKIQDEEQPVEAEQRKQLSILDSILGPNNKVTVKPAKKQNNRLATIVRFDPSKPEHAQKYKVDVETMPTKKSKKLLEEKEEQSLRANETAMPEVSSERFYEVSSALQQTLRPKSDFSLRALFGNNDQEQDHQVSEEQNVSQPILKTRDATSQPAPIVKVATTWSESFFFKSQDHRLQVGVDFFTNRGEESRPQFEQRRRELWTAVKSKLRNVAKKMVTFERKLGGKSTKHRHFKSKRLAKPRRK